MACAEHLSGWTWAHWQVPQGKDWHLKPMDGDRQTIHIGLDGLPIIIHQPQMPSFSLRRLPMSLRPNTQVLWCSKPEILVSLLPRAY